MVGEARFEVVPCPELDDRAVAALAELLSTSSSERSEGDPPISPEQLALDERITPPWRRRTRALAWSLDGRLLATCLLEVEDRADNRRLAWIEASTAPDVRRRGLGTEVVVRLLPAALAEGRTLLMGGAPEGRPGAAFASALGLAVGQREHSNRARTVEMPVEVLRTWVAAAATEAAGYSLEAVDGPFPEELLAPYAALALIMNDAPIDDLELEDFRYTADELRSGQQAAERRGAIRWTVVARHDATDELVGLTELLIPRHDRWLAEQGDTGVAAAHRGHGLGRWLKATNALRLLEEHPEVEAIQTWNASTNPHMLAINHAMGFRAETVQELVQGDIAELLDRLGGAR